jgi:hypothetical protein
MTSSDFAAELKLALCESFDVRQDSPDHWTIRSPFIFEDGDNLPSFVTHVDGSWRLTDQGMTVSHLFFDEFQFTEARFNRISQLVLSHSVRVRRRALLASGRSGPGCRPHVSKRS